MSELNNYAIRKLLEGVYNGQVRIPAFQRGFVWEPLRVAHFLDSIYKGYPFGSLLFWLTNERLISDRRLGPYELPEPNEESPHSLRARWPAALDITIRDVSDRLPASL